VLHRVLALAALLVLAHGCATEPTPAQFMRVSPQSAPSREAQTRHFSGVSEAGLLAAGVSVMQDLGFRIKTSDAKLGVIVGTKPRPIEDILADIGRLSLLVGVTFGLYQTPEIAMGPPDAFEVVLTMRPTGTQTGGYSVRVMFYQLWSPQSLSPDATRMRGAIVIDSPTLYQKFFGMLSANLARERPGN
jgi:hypothetical protein